MSNTLGLSLIALFIGGIVAFVIFVNYMAKNPPDTKIGALSKKIDKFIDNLPEDD
ncbi:MAG: hypothetical protein PVF83_13335 [Anaerolineales bacterium]|jgi:uncharacterized protein YneF (UPF0154 family)